MATFAIPLFRQERHCVIEHTMTHRHRTYKLEVRYKVNVSYLAPLIEAWSTFGFIHILEQIFNVSIFILVCIV